MTELLMRNIQRSDELRSDSRTGCGPDICPAVDGTVPHLFSLSVTRAAANPFLHIQTIHRDMALCTLLFYA